MPLSHLPDLALPINLHSELSSFFGVAVVSILKDDPFYLFVSEADRYVRDLRHIVHPYNDHRLVFPSPSEIFSGMDVNSAIKELDLIMDVSPGDFVFSSRLPSPGPTSEPFDYYGLSRVLSIEENEFSGNKYASYHRHISYRSYSEQIETSRIGHVVYPLKGELLKIFRSYFPEVFVPSTPSTLSPLP